MPNGMIRQLTPTLVATGAGGGVGLVVGLTQKTNPALANILTTVGLVGGLGLAFVNARGMMADAAVGLAAGSGALLGHRLGRGELGLASGFRRLGGGVRATRMLASGRDPGAALQVSVPEEQETLVTVL